MHLKVGKFTTTTEAYRATKLQFRWLGDQNRLFPAGRDGARLCRLADAHGLASLAGARRLAEEKAASGPPCRVLEALYSVMRGDLH